MQPIGWELRWQDFRGRQPGIGLERPPVLRAKYATRAEADAARASLPVHDDVVANVVPIYLKAKPSHGKALAAAGLDLPTQRAT